MAVGNEENLIPFNELTEEEQRELARKGGIASGISRNKRKTLKAELLLLLSEGDTQSKISLALIKKCFEGDVSAIKELAILINERTEKSTNENVEVPLEAYLKKIEAKDEY